MNDQELTHIDLFTGVGGFTLAAQWTGFRTVAFCEKDNFCQKVLQKHWPEVPIIPEIRDFDGTKWRGATLLTGGFPCQPFSHAGKRKGKEDDRYLWPQMFCVIKEAKPRWVLIENVTGIVKLALGQVLSDLEGIGYDFPRDHEGTPIVPVIPACGLNAPHRRYRVWIIANSIGAGTRNKNGKIDDQGGQSGKNRREGIRQENGSIGTGGTTSTDSHASDSECLGWQEGARGRIEHEKQISERQNIGNGYSKRDASDSNGFDGNNAGYGSGKISFVKEAEIFRSWQQDWYEVATRFCRVDDGLPSWIHSHRVKRLKALGNAIVPQIAYEIMKRIAWIENESHIR